jgi:hypothetical protein
VAKIIRSVPDLSGRLYHYNGEVVLRFSPTLWTYYHEQADGTLKPIRGVTGSLKIIGGSKTDMLINWSVKKDFERLVELLVECRRGDGFVESPWPDIEQMVAVAKREHKIRLETAGDIGHGAHEHLEGIAKSLMAGDNPRLYELLAKWPEDPQSCNAAIAGVAWLCDHNVRFIASEQRVLSREWMVCGTMDGDALVDSCGQPDCSCARYAPFKDKRLVVDYKTSNGVYSSMFGQMAVYRKAKVEEFPDIKYDGSVLLRIGKDEKHEFESFFTLSDDEYHQHLTLFKNALDLKDSVESVEKWMEDIRDNTQREAKLRKAAEKAAKKLLDCGDSEGYKGVRQRTCGDGKKACQTCQTIYETTQALKEGQ